MAYSLNNATPGVAYAATATLEGLEPCVKVNFAVSNGLVFYQIKTASFGIHGASGTWLPEVALVPGSKSVTRNGITGVRVRANGITTPLTLVSLEVVGANEGA